MHEPFPRFLDLHNGTAGEEEEGGKLHSPRYLVISRPTTVSKNWVEVSDVSNQKRGQPTLSMGVASGVLVSLLYGV